VRRGCGLQQHVCAGVWGGEDYQDIFGGMSLVLSSVWWWSESDGVQLKGHGDADGHFRDGIRMTMDEGRGNGWWEPMRAALDLSHLER